MKQETLKQLANEMIDTLPFNTPEYWIGRIKEALAQPEQEPVADALHFAQWDAAKKDLSEYIHVGSLTLAGIEDNLDGTEFGESEIERFEAVIEALQEKLINGRECKKVPLIAYIGGHNRHATQPQRPWVGLFDEEIEVLFQTAAGADEEVHIRFARAIESKLNEVNT